MLFFIYNKKKESVLSCSFIICFFFQNLYIFVFPTNQNESNIGSKVVNDREGIQHNGTVGWAGEFKQLATEKSIILKMRVITKQAQE